jgi:hypothetical protein
MWMCAFLQMEISHIVAACNNNSNELNNNLQAL